MRGEGVRHPTTSIKRNGYLTFSVPLSLLSMDCWFKLCTNAPISIMQYTKSGICDMTSFGFD